MSQQKTNSNKTQNQPTKQIKPHPYETETQIQPLNGSLVQIHITTRGGSSLEMPP